MPQTKASARISIDKLVAAIGGRLFSGAIGPANCSPGPNVKITLPHLDAMGDATRRPYRTRLRLMRQCQQRAAQALVNPDRECFGRFEGKIKSTIDRAWSTA